MIEGIARPDRRKADSGAPGATKHRSDNQKGSSNMANEGEERIVMDLEVRLKDDQDGSLRSEVAAGIAEQMAVIDATLKEGVPPAEYQKLNTIKSGLGSASLILDRIWSYYHR